MRDKPQIMVQNKVKGTADGGDEEGGTTDSCAELVEAYAARTRVFAERKEGEPPITPIFAD